MALYPSSVMWGGKDEWGREGVVRAKNNLRSTLFVFVRASVLNAWNKREIVTRKAFLLFCAFFFSILPDVFTQQHLNKACKIANGSRLLLLFLLLSLLLLLPLFADCMPFVLHCSIGIQRRRYLGAITLFRLSLFRVNYLFTGIDIDIWRRKKIKWKWGTGNTAAVSCMCEWLRERNSFHSHAFKLCPEFSPSNVVISMQLFNGWRVFCCVLSARHVKDRYMALRWRARHRSRCLADV